MFTHHIQNKDNYDHMVHVVFSSGKHASDPKLEMKLLRSGASETYLSPDNWMHEHAQSLLNAMWGAWCARMDHSTLEKFKISAMGFRDLVVTSLDTLLDAIVNDS